MNWQHTPYALPLFAAAAISIGVLFIDRQRRHASGARAVAVMMFGVAIWSAGYAFELSSATLSTAMIWAKFQYLGIVSVPTAWMLFAFTYTGATAWINRRTLILLSVMPVITLGLVWTNAFHGLIWQGIAWGTHEAFAHIDVEHGTFFWIHALYSYIILCIGTLQLFRAMLRSPHLYRRQFSTLLLGISSPWIVNALYIFGFSPIPHLDITPFAFLVTGVAMAHSLVRFRLLDIVPVGHASVLKNMDDGVMVLDKRGRVVDINPAAERVVGPAAQLIGQVASERFAHLPHFIERARHELAFVEEYVFGEGANQRFLDVRVAPLYDQQQMRGWLIVWRDISEQKRAETALRENELRYRSLYAKAQRQTQELELIDHIRVALTQQTELSALFRTVVEGIANTFGYTLVGLYILREHHLYLQHQVGYETVMDAIPITKGVMGKVVRTGQPILLTDVHNEPEFLSAITGIVSEVCVPLFDQGQVVGTLNVESFHGVELTEEDLRLLLVLGQSVSIAIERTSLYSKQQEAQALLKSQYVLLQQEVLERRRAEAALAQAKDAAEAANRAKSTFLASMSHELRTPLTAICGYSELLELDLNERGHTDLVADSARIRQAGDHLLKLINNILDLSKIEAGKITLSAETFDLQLLITETVATTQGLIEQNGNVFVVQSVEEPILCYTDSTKLRQIMLNLLSNAAKFTHNGVVKLQVFITHSPLSSGLPNEDPARLSEPWLIIEVTDTGIGIVPEQLHTLFQPFTQANDTISQTYGGTGLGLMLTRRFCEMLGGRIDVESAYGHGSTFRVQLPTILPDHILQEIPIQ